MSDGLMGVGAGYRDRALSGLVREAGLREREYIESKSLKLQKQIAEVSSQQQMAQSIASLAMSAVSFGLGGGFGGGQNEAPQDQGEVLSQGNIDFPSEGYFQGMGPEGPTS